MKIRIKFTKQGAMKFIGHLDVMRYFQKVMRKADVDIRYSEGFSPHQIMSFAAPLGVGMTGAGEYVDIEVHSTDSSSEMLRRINGAMVEGFTAVSYRRLPDDAGNAMSIVAAADYTVSFRQGQEPKDWTVFCDTLNGFLDSDEILVLKKTKKGEAEVNIRPMIYEIRICDHSIFLKIATGSAANLRPEMVIGACMDHLSQTLAPHALIIQREEVYASLEEGGETRFLPLEELGETIE